MNIGHMAFLVARRESAIRGLSGTAKHLAFPALYKRPDVDGVYVAKRLPRKVVQIVPPTEESVRPRQPVNPQRAAFKCRAEIERIVTACARQWEVRPADIVGASHKPIHTEPRFAAIKIMREYLRLSMPAIGWALGRDHSSVSNALRRADEFQKADRVWRAKHEAASMEVESTSLPHMDVSRKGARQLCISPAGV